MGEESVVAGDGDGATSTYMTYFNRHFGYSLSKEEAAYLENRTWRFDRPLHASIDDAKSELQWIGTEEPCADERHVQSASCSIKPQLLEYWMDVFMRNSTAADFDSSNRGCFLSLCSRYRDIINYNKKPFYVDDSKDGEDSSAMDAYIMHSLNHVFKSRDLVIRNDRKLASLRDKGCKDEMMLADYSLCDRGFTRPKVLILLPLASIAYRVVKRLIQLTPLNRRVDVEHMDRFCKNFGTWMDEEGVEMTRSLRRSSSKPADFHVLFGGNNNDHFMLGIKFTRKSIRLYSDFYSSDIIIASPLGLVTKIEEAKKVKEKDVDYLSSIEVLIVDHADVMAMQNWVHVDSAVAKLNQMPAELHGSNAMRVKQWHLSGLSRYYRQTIVLGFYLTPDMNALFNHQCVNFQGKVKLACEYEDVTSRIPLQVPQIFQRFDVESTNSIENARKVFFEEKIFPRFRDSDHGGVMIFLRSHMEVVLICKFLTEQNASYCVLDEDTHPSDVSRARLWFYEGKREIILYTERAHFHRRYRIRGIKKLIMYNPPERKELYIEMVNMLQGSHERTATALFCRFDNLQLQRIIGTIKAKWMLKSDKEVFVSC